MALNYLKVQAANVSNTELTAMLPTLTDNEKVIVGHACEELVKHGTDDMRCSVTDEAWSVTPAPPQPAD